MGYFKILKNIIPVLLFLFSCTAISQGIRNSHHDFSGAAWSNNEICRPCHIPHHADQTVDAAPLWSHELTTAGFTPYPSGGTMQSVPGMPSGISLLCLSCHDGTVAIENHYTYTTGILFAGFGNLTTVLSNDHPISFIYNDALAAADGNLHAPSATLSGLGGTIEEDLLESGKMECTSCHDVHISRNTQGCTGCHIMGSPITTISLSLWMDNTNSELCLTCHDK